MHRIEPDTRCTGLRHVKIGDCPDKCNAVLEDGYTTTERPAAERFSGFDSSNRCLIERFDMTFRSIRLNVLFICSFFLCLQWTTPLVAEPVSKTPRSALLSTNTPIDSKDFIRQVKPKRIHERTCTQIVDTLRHRHYRKLPIDDLLSEKLLDRFLSELDKNRLYFLESDIRRFDAYRYTLDDHLKSGNLTAAFTIFNQYQQRIVERLVFLVNRLAEGLDNINLGLVESLETDREKAPWAQNPEELRDLWRKMFKNEVLKQKLAGKSISQIKKKLTRRYQSQLNRARQTVGEDAFRIYMNSLAMLFGPHSQYFSPHMSENFKIQMSLSLEGIGAVLQTEDEHTKVVRLVPAGPADKGKALMAGDRITGVGQGPTGEIVDVVGWRLDDVVELIRGEKGTVVRLEILPAGIEDNYQTKIISITRNTVKLEEQAAQKDLIELTHDGKTYKIGVIDIPTFYLDFNAYHSGKSDYKSTTRDVKRLLQELVNEGVDGVVVDLRDNGGGALQEANDLTGLFIKKGPTVQVRNTNGRVTSIHDKNAAVVYNGPLVVVVNRMSASAAEIFSGAIQDYRRGIITGSQTFGKGTVQSLLDLEHGQLKLTIAKFYRVSGDSTQHQGIIPDIRYPPIYDADIIGESAFPDALPWSKIKPVRFRPYPDLAPYVEQMRQRHETRKSASPDFAYLMESIENLKEGSQTTRLPLNETSRKLFMDRLKNRRLVVENRRRLAKGLKPVQRLEDLEQENTGESMGSTTNNPEEPDPLLIESGRILADLISLTRVVQ